jgi:hypothetical protein
VTLCMRSAWRHPRGGCSSLVIVLVAIVLTGCSGSRERGGPTSPTFSSPSHSEATASGSSPSNPPSSPAGPPSFEPLRERLARATLLRSGSDYVVSPLTPRLPHGTTWSLRALDPEGDAVIAYSPPSPRAITAQTRVGVVDPSDGVVHAVPSVTDQPTAGIAEVTATPRWIVWATSSSRDLLHLQWTLFAYNRETGRTIEIASSGNRFGVDPPTPTDGLHLSVVGDAVFYTGLLSVGPRFLVTGIFRAPLDGSSAPSLVVRGAYAGTARGSQLLYVAGHNGTFEQWSLHARNLETGTDRILQASGPDSPSGLPGPGSRYSGYSYGGGELYWHTAVVSSLPSESSTAVFSSVPSESAFSDTTRIFADHGLLALYLGPVCTNGLLFNVSAGSYRPFLYNPQSQRIFRLTSDRIGGIPLANGSYVAWRTASGAFAGRTFIATLK